MRIFGTIALAAVIACSNDHSMHGSQSKLDQQLGIDDANAVNVVTEVNPEAAGSLETLSEEIERYEAKAPKESYGDDISIPTQITGSYLFCQRQAIEEYGTLELACYVADDVGMVLSPDIIEAPTVIARFERNMALEPLTASLIDSPSSIFTWRYRTSRYPGGRYTIEAMDSEGNALVYQELEEDPDKLATRTEYLSAAVAGSNLLVTIDASYFATHGDSSLALYRQADGQPQASWLSQPPSMLSLRSCTNFNGNENTGSLTTDTGINTDLTFGTSAYYLVYLHRSTICPGLNAPLKDMLLIHVENRQIRTIYAPIQVPE